jgi:phosphate starvation-inducible PhoH-like protein
MQKRKTPVASTVKFENIRTFEALTNNQKRAKESWNKGKNLILSGSAGTGKTYLAFHFALTEVLPKHSEYDKVIVIRSIVPTRDIGFLPGDEKEKKEAYELPYRSIAANVTDREAAWKMMLENKTIEFESTSFIRGLTLDNCIIIVDEMQNLNFHELDSVITRIGYNTRIIFCGDYHQSDFKNANEKNGLLNFLEIIDHMESFDVIKFGWEDIVRSDFVRDYIMTKEMIEEKSNEKTSNSSRT